MSPVVAVGDGATVVVVGAAVVVVAAIVSGGDGASGGVGAGPPLPAHAPAVSATTTRRAAPRPLGRFFTGGLGVASARGGVEDDLDGTLVAPGGGVEGLVNRVEGEAVGDQSP